MATSKAIKTKETKAIIKVQIKSFSLTPNVLIKTPYLYKAALVAAFCGFEAKIKQ
jgi:hypothetical protein